MKRQRAAHRLPYTAEQMFDLVADIERYPEFLPHWPRATIQRREGNVLHVLQEIDLGIRQLRFESCAVLERPAHLQITSQAAPFRRMQVEWQFTPDGQGSVTTVTIEIEMQSPLMEVVAGELIGLMMHDVFDRFQRRAAALYAAAPG
ncbi:MAG: SRPBCC family protein [Gammaproteobacteria bacterium]